MKNGTTTSSRNAAISPYSSDIARILLGNIHGRADAPHPALAGCARAVSSHVAAVHTGSFLRRGNPDPRMSLVGQKEKPPFSALCQLPPAADMPLDELMYEMCQRTKSLRDSCGVWRALSDIHRGEMVSSGGSALS